MSRERELLKRLYQFVDVDAWDGKLEVECEKLLQEIEAELANPEPEPVAYKLEHSDGSHVGYLSDSNYQLQKTDISESEIISIPLYTYPPAMKRLSDDELDELHFQNPDDPFAFARAVETALMEKNK